MDHFKITDYTVERNTSRSTITKLNAVAFLWQCFQYLHAKSRLTILGEYTVAEHVTLQEEDYAGKIRTDKNM
jgi:hypothetical protein